MNARITATVAAMLLAGCASYEGRYAPGCLAHAGSYVTLDSGTYVWERFTDQVNVDSDGNVIEPFPDYPKRGNYRLDGQILVMESDSGQPMENMYLHRDGDRRLLLTAEQYSAWRKTGSYADCVLTLSAASDN